jgi:hypothetical protein
MTTHHISLRQHILRLAISVVTVVATGAGIVTAASGAIFTDTETTSMDVASGWVDVTTGGTTMLPLSNMKPGDSMFRTVNIANQGSLDFVYDITAAPVNGPSGILVDAMLVETWLVENADVCNSAGYQSGTQTSSSTLSALHMHDHSIAPNSAETVCFKLTLPSTVNNNVAGKSARVDVVIATTQA